MIAIDMFQVALLAERETSTIHYKLNEPHTVTWGGRTVTVDIVRMSSLKGELLSSVLFMSPNGDNMCFDIEDGQWLVPGRPDLFYQSVALFMMEYQSIQHHGAMVAVNSIAAAFTGNDLPDTPILLSDVPELLQDFCAGASEKLSDYFLTRPLP